MKGLGSLPLSHVCVDGAKIEAIRLLTKGVLHIGFFDNLFGVFGLKRNASPAVLTAFSIYIHVISLSFSDKITYLTSLSLAILQKHVQPNFHIITHNLRPEHSDGQSQIQESNSGLSRRSRITPVIDVS